MPTVFEIKRVLDAMNKLGTQYSGVKTVSEAAAAQLLLPVNHPAVALAALYSSYELLCFSINKKPVSLGTWMARSPRREKYAS